jgi:hypothetical protein
VPHKYHTTTNECLNHHHHHHHHHAPQLIMTDGAAQVEFASYDIKVLNTESVSIVTLLGIMCFGRLQT